MTAAAWPIRERLDGRRLVPYVVTLNLLIALMVVLLARWGPDWPAQEFRATLAREAGLVAWNNGWYAGHALPGYSALYPLLASVLGASLTGACAVAAAAWAALQLLPATADRSARRWIALAVTLSLVECLVIGQVPFLLGAAFGLAAVVALLRDHQVTTLLMAALSSLSSPLAGGFLLLVAVGLTAVVGRRAALLAGALCGPVVAVVVGGAGGPFPCAWTDLVGVLAFCALTWVVSGPKDVVLRRLSAIYAVAVLLAYFVSSPVGGNISRLGKLVAAPLACWLLMRPGNGRRIVAATGLVASLLWSGIPATTSILDGSGDPSRQVAFYSGLMTFLRTQNPIAGRLEIPLTREHWETSFVASDFPLARGWERQTDLLDNPALYAPLTPASYKVWLDAQGVALVALPNVPIDYGGRAELLLLDHPMPYLQLVYTDANWRVWRVSGAHPLATGAARMTRLGPASFEVAFSRAGSAVVRLRASGLWEVSTGTACLSATPDGWLQVTSPRPGPVTIRARLNMAMFSGPRDCD